MKLFIDEAGNTGSIDDKKGELNYKEQRHFCLAAVVVNSKQEEKLLRRKYRKFKDKYLTGGNELKGLLTRENNEALEYFIKELLNDRNFTVCCYDKKFYLASLLAGTILGPGVRIRFPAPYYTVIGALAHEDDDLYLNFCRLTKKPTVDSVHELLTYLKDYPYRYLSPGNIFVYAVEAALKEGVEDSFIEDFLQVGSFSNPKFANLVNLTALGEMCNELMLTNGLTVEQLEIVHDETHGIEVILKEEMAHVGLNVEFHRSIDDDLVQFADNVAGLLYKVMNHAVHCWESGTEWRKENEWLLMVGARIMQKIGVTNIRFKMSVQNWALMRCVIDMFGPGYAKSKRNGYYFHERHKFWQEQILYTISNIDFSACADGFKQLLDLEQYKV